MKAKQMVAKVREMSNKALDKLSEKSDLSFIQNEDYRKKTKIACLVALPVAVLGAVGLESAAMSVIGIVVLLMVLSGLNLDALLEKLEKTPKKVVSKKKEDKSSESEEKAEEKVEEVDE